jgi:hypothetical protein
MRRKSRSGIIASFATTDLLELVFGFALWPVSNRGPGAAFTLRLRRFSLPRQSRHWTKPALSDLSKDEPSKRRAPPL